MSAGASGPFETLTENRKVGGSPPPLATTPTAGQTPSDAMKGRGLLPLPAAPPSVMIGSIQVPH